MAGQKNRKALHTARREAVSSTLGIRLDIDPVDAMQEVLDRAVAVLRHAGLKADEVSEDEMYVSTAFGPVPNQWIRLEADMRDEVTRIANSMVRSGIADRAVRVQEARAVLFVQAIQAAAAEVGISRDQVKSLGPALRRHLTAASEGGAEAVEGSVAA